MISIVAGTKKSLREDFIVAAHHANEQDKAYIPRLNWEMREHLSPKNPFFQHATHQLFVAYLNKKPVGRISAQIDTLAQRVDKPVTGHFGFLDAINHEVATALLKEAERWMILRGASEVMGPFSFSINEESGMLIEGFDTAPYIMMNHAPEWLGNAVEQAGYTKAKDLLAFAMNIANPFPKSAQKLANEAEQLAGFHIRPLNLSSLENDVRIVVKIFNEAWKDNWGFIPMTEAEISAMAKNIKPILIPQLGQIIEINGKPAAMILALPNIMEAIADLKGRLFPFAWAKLLYRLKWQGLHSARVLLMGISPQYREGVKGAVLSASLIDRLRKECQARHIKEIEMSWILEDNKAMIRIIEAVGGLAYKRYRIYSKSLI